MSAAVATATRSDILRLKAKFLAQRSLWSTRDDDKFAVNALRPFTHDCTRIPLLIDSFSIVPSNIPTLPSVVNSLTAPSKILQSFTVDRENIPSQQANNGKSLSNIPLPVNSFTVDTAKLPEYVSTTATQENTGVAPVNETSEREPLKPIDKASQNGSEINADSIEITVSAVKNYDISPVTSSQPSLLEDNLASFVELDRLMSVALRKTHLISLLRQRRQRIMSDKRRRNEVLIDRLVLRRVDQLQNHLDRGKVILQRLKVRRNL